MASGKSSVFRDVDDSARSLARSLLSAARHGALGTLCADGTAPMVTRIAIGTDPAGVPVTLVSELSMHTENLRVQPGCSLLVGEPGPRGDVLTHPRLTLQCQAEITDKARAKPLYLTQHPKAALYFDFSDFLMVRLNVQHALLNGGFGKAYRLVPSDLDLP